MNSENKYCNVSVNLFVVLSFISIIIVSFFVYFDDPNYEIEKVHKAARTEEQVCIEDYGDMPNRLIPAKCLKYFLPIQMQ